MVISQSLLTIDKESMLLLSPSAHETDAVLVAHLEDGSPQVVVEVLQGVWLWQAVWLHLEFWRLLGSYEACIRFVDIGLFIIEVYFSELLIYKSYCHISFLELPHGLEIVILGHGIWHNITIFSRFRFLNLFYTLLYLLDLLDTCHFINLGNYY